MRANGVERRGFDGRPSEATLFLRPAPSARLAPAWPASKAEKNSNYCRRLALAFRLRHKKPAPSTGAIHYGRNPLSTRKPRASKYRVIRSPSDCRSRRRLTPRSRPAVESETCVTLTPTTPHTWRTLVRCTSHPRLSAFDDVKFANEPRQLLSRGTIQSSSLPLPPSGSSLRRRCHCHVVRIVFFLACVYVVTLHACKSFRHCST